jgi:bacterioferritin (cytochrome b1)
MTREELVEKLNDDLSRERYHHLFYLLSASLVTGLHREEMSEFFLKQAESEMKHIKQFQDVILELGGKPSVIPSGHPVITINWPHHILGEALKMEDEVVKNYVERLDDAAELGGVDGTYVGLFIEDQLLDSKSDAANIRRMVM